MDQEVFGGWLKRCRKDLDLTQGELARQIGCSVETIRKIEANKLRPSKQIVERLAQQLDIPLQERTAFLRFARTSSPTSLEELSVESTAPIIQQPCRDYLSNLPTPLTPLIGREREVALTQERMSRADVRLLTLTGAPGIGKTRLALGVAAELRDTFDDGVFFVDLAPIQDAGLVAAAIAQALDVYAVGGQSVHLSLHAYLQSRHTLLVLDNFEHLLPAAPLVAGLLMAAPRLKVLVTSRARLQLYGEHEFAVPPLALPDLAQLPPVPLLAEYPAVALFVARVQAIKPDFVLRSANAATVAAICARLDGLPLALELAASRSRLFTPEVLLTKLTDQLGLLTDGPRDMPARQQTLRSMIAWSYDLLAPHEQALFRRVGIFVGGGSSEGIAEVCLAPLTNSTVPQHDQAVAQASARDAVLVHLMALVDKSLLQQIVADEGDTRFVMLETVRAYALDQVAAHRELDALRQRHAAFYTRLVAEIAPRLRGLDQAQWLDRLEHDYENLRAALGWLLESKQLDAGLCLAGGLTEFWSVRGYFSEGRQWLEQLLAGTAGSTIERARTLYGAGLLAYRQGDYRVARAHYAESRELYRHLRDQQGIATALVGLGDIAFAQNDNQRARQFFDEGLELFRSVGERRGAARALTRLGTTARRTGDFLTARRLLEESLVRSREVRDQSGTAWTLYHLGIAAYYLEDFALERVCYEESLALQRRLGDKWGIAFVLNNLGNSSLYAEDYAQARAFYQESLLLYQKLGDRNGIAMIYYNLGELARLQGGDREATAHYRTCLDLYHQLGNQSRVAASLHALGYTALHQGNQREAMALFQESLALYQTLGERFGVARCLIGIASVLGTQGQPLVAARLSGAAEGRCEDGSRRLDAVEHIEHERNRAAIHAHLDATTFAAAWAVGRTLSLEQAIAEAQTTVDDQ